MSYAQVMRLIEWLKERALLFGALSFVMVASGVARLFYISGRSNAHPVLLIVVLAYLIGPLCARFASLWLRKIPHRKSSTEKRKPLLTLSNLCLLALVCPALILSCIWGLIGALAIASRKVPFTLELPPGMPRFVSRLVLVPTVIAYLCVGNGGVIFGAWMAIGSGTMAVLMAFAGLDLEGDVLRLFKSSKDVTPGTVLTNGFVFALSAGAVHFAIWKAWPTEYIGIHSWIDTLYFSVVTMATVGYGDVVPVGFLAKGATLIQIVVSIMILAIAVSAAISVWIMNHQPGAAAEIKKGEAGEAKQTADGGSGNG